MRIADQYNSSPTMRLKWLKQIVKINMKNENPISAFIAQLHVAALIEYVIEYSKNLDVKIPNFYLSLVQPVLTSQITKKSKDFNPNFQYVLSTKNDFSFMPGVLIETKLDIQAQDASSKVLLSDFSIPLLISALEKAIKIGNDAHMYYSMRPIFSLLIRIYQTSHDYAKASDVLKKLGETIGKIPIILSKGYDYNISFFLVEYRKKDGTINRQIFTVSRLKVDQFMNSLNSSKRFDEFNAEKCNKHSDKCNKPGVCVVRLTPVEKNSSSFEYPHCWSVFRTEPNDLTSDMDLIEYVSKDPLPHYRWCTCYIIKTNSYVIFGLYEIIV